jgi:DNA polymerase-3 subunit epsilon
VTTLAGEELLQESVFVNPGVPIPPGASAIHGITDVMVADATPLVEAVELLADRLIDVWTKGQVVVGMNVSYDLSMVDSLCHRLGRATLDERGGVGPVLDVLILDRHFDKWRKGSRKLTDLCQVYGVSLGSAHSAADDALASLDVLDAQRVLYPEVDQIPLDAMNETLRGWYQEWLSSFSIYLEKKGEAPISAGRYDWPIQSSD